MEIISVSELLDNQAQFAATVALAVAWLKNRFNLNGNRTVLVSFVVAAVLVLAGLLEQSYPAIIQYLILIVVGAVSAGGGVDLVKGVLKR